MAACTSIAPPEEAAGSSSELSSRTRVSLDARLELPDEVPLDAEDPPDLSFPDTGEAPADTSAEPKCACKYAADDPNAKILVDNCPKAQVCADAACIVEVNRGGDVERERSPCEDVTPPAPPPPPEPRRCTSVIDCPVTDTCYEGICRKLCGSHAGCTAPDKCFSTIIHKVCLNEGEYRCSSYVHTSCERFVLESGPACGSKTAFYEQHENHGANVYCDVEHEVNACKLNAARTGCVLEPAPRRCWAMYFE